jgi:superfamily I DNA and/or RNA helicase
VSAEVAVLAGYRAQVSELRRLLADDESTWQAITVDVSTIDAFQGREADVTVYSVTRSNPDRRIGFLAERRRLNVALSRARDLLVIVGDHTATTSGSGNPFAEILEHIEDQPEDCELSEAEL